MKKLLIVVDMQNDFVSGALGTEQARQIAPKVVDKIMGFDGDVLYTLDTHDANYMATQEGKKLPVPHCIAGTDGWAPTAGVWMALMEKNVADEAHLIIKDTFGAKDLPIRLHEMYGDDLPETTLVGLCTDICVISNALLLKAFFPEMPIVVDASCCAGATVDGHATALASMRICQIDVINDN